MIKNTLQAASAIPLAEICDYMLFYIYEHYFSTVVTFPDLLTLPKKGKLNAADETLRSQLKTFSFIHFVSSFSLLAKCNLFFGFLQLHSLEHDKSWLRDRLSKNGQRAVSVD